MQNFTLQFWKRYAVLSLILSVLLLSNVYAQQTITVSGVVTAKEDGSPLPGTTVVVKNAKEGVAADASGKFTIKVAAGSTLVFQAVGYLPLEASVNGST